MRPGLDFQAGLGYPDSEEAAMRNTLLLGCAWLAIGCYQSFSDLDAVGDVDGRRDDARTDARPDAWPDSPDDPAVVLDFEQPGMPPVDIVVLVDNSGSMSAEQAALGLRFTEFLADLVEPALDPGTGRPSHPPVEDLNVAVISPDMGTAGHLVSTCANPDGGDRGCFRSAPSAVVPGCEATYPSFLSRNRDNAASYPAARLAQDFVCIGTLGTDGCGFEQPLAAMLAAVTAPNAGPGGCNAGFLRTDSLLALLFLTDEEDCSVRPDHPEMFDLDRTDLGHLNIRCFLHPDFVVPVEEYVAAFRALRAAPERLVLGFIVGVPPDAPQCVGPGDELDGCLELPQMMEAVDPTAPTQLIPSCNTSMGQAFPPRRFVELARAFGSQARVDSICKSDWTGSLPGLTDRVALPSEAECLAREPEYVPGGCRVDCVLVETLDDDRECPADLDCPPAWCPPATEAEAFAAAPCANPLTGAVCEPLKRDLGTVTGGDGWPRRLCLVRQADPAPGARCGLPAEAGWYFVPASASPERCPTAFFEGPPDGALLDGRSRVVVRCR